MTKNRRFPFERSKEKILLEDLSTNEEQLYPSIRQYLSICRCINDKTRQSTAHDMIYSNKENYRLNELINHLKQECDDNFVDRNNISSLRDHNSQHWKYIKYQWQKYYREEIKREQDLFDNLIKTSRR